VFCHYTQYPIISVEVQIFIPIFIDPGDYKKFELVWNISSITVELSTMCFQVLDVQGLNLHTQTGYMN